MSDDKLYDIYSELVDINTELEGLRLVLTPTNAHDWHKHTCGECGYWCGWCRRSENPHHADYEGFAACPAFIQRPKPESEEGS